ncbi:MAG: hypothetical protein R2867_13175 [Caldilineaceae bacterium]
MAASEGKFSTDYTQFLDKDGLKGARIGIARNFFGFHERVDAIMEECIAALKRAGAPWWWIRWRSTMSKNSVTRSGRPCNMSLKQI